jgi:hypothetical protein
MTLDRIRARLATADADGHLHQATALRGLLVLIQAEAARNHRDAPTETDVQTALRKAVFECETREDRLVLANRMGAAEISEQDVRMFAEFIDVKT